MQKKGFAKTPQLLSAFANAVNSLNGQYIVSVDMGSDSEDMKYIHKTTQYVIGYDQEEGGAGDPGLFTARGVLAGMKSAAREKWASSSLRNKKILVMGLGDVGLPLSKTLIEMGAHLIVADIDLKKIQAIREYNSDIKVVGPEEIYFTKCDFFAPCAGGGLLTSQNAQDFQCQIIAGASNNQLSEDSAGDILHEKGILYIPDFSINGGGLIGVVTHGLKKQSKQYTFEKIDQIGSLVQKIIRNSKKSRCPTHRVALDMAYKKYKIQHFKNKSKKELILINKIIDFILQYKYVFLTFIFICIASFAGYLVYIFLDNKNIQKEQTLIDQFQLQLIQEEKKYGGSILDDKASFLSPKKTIDYHLISKTVEKYLNFLKSKEKPKPIHWAAGIELGYFLIQYGKTEMALQLLEFLSSKAKSRQWLYHLMILNLGSLFMKEKNYTRAIHLFSMVLSEDRVLSFHLEAWFKTAVCYEALGKHEKAQEIYSMIQEKQEGVLYKKRASDYDRLLRVQQKLKQARKD